MSQPYIDAQVRSFCIRIDATRKAYDNNVIDIEEYISEISEIMNELLNEISMKNLVADMAMDYLHNTGMIEEFTAFAKNLRDTAEEKEKTKLTLVKH